MPCEPNYWSRPHLPVPFNVICCLPLLSTRGLLGIARVTNEHWQVYGAVNKLLFVACYEPVLDWGHLVNHWLGSLTEHINPRVTFTKTQKSTALLMGSIIEIMSFKFLINTLYRVAKKKHRTVDTVDFSGLCSDQQLSFFTLLDRASFPHYNNTKSSNLVENFLFYE